MPVMRLDKFFSSQEILSRKEVKFYVSKGSIKVNDTVVMFADQKIDTQNDKIYLLGKEMLYKPFVYIMLNKPQGVVSSTNDKINKTVLDLVPKELFRSDLFPAGRLDKDTVGFVLLTNDGDFAHQILSPKNHVDKKYLVRLDHAINKADVELIQKGITLANGYVCQPAQVRVIEDTQTPLVEVILREGKYHQIKRMFGVVDCVVIYLKRTKIGGLELDSSLEEGCCREILHNEVEKILVK